MYRQWRSMECAEEAITPGTGNLRKEVVASTTIFKIQKVFQTPNRTHSMKLTKTSERFNTTQINVLKKIRALQIVFEAKREEIVDDGLINAKSLCEELEISIELPRRIRWKHIFGDGSKDVQLTYEVDLRPTMFSTVDRITADVQKRFQQL
ncbi:uncharacterized protein TNCV_2932401 [Trichonephila clavipes]|nr:uncharacterized protein TNCV_2932401 [Trichonephila clavipes]